MKDMKIMKGQRTKLFMPFMHFMVPLVLCATRKVSNWTHNPATAGIGDP